MANNEQSYFSALSINPRGQLCLSLNRPSVFATTINQVLNLGPAYGHDSVSPMASDSSQCGQCGCITLVHHSSTSLQLDGSDHRRLATCTSGQSHDQCRMYTESQVGGEKVSTSLREETTAATCAGSTLSGLGLNKGRSLLVLGLLLKLLQVQGHSVAHYTSLPQVL